MVCLKASQRVNEAALGEGVFKPRRMFAFLLMKI